VSLTEQLTANGAIFRQPLRSRMPAALTVPHVFADFAAMVPKADIPVKSIARR
jgi:hypothetical protein